MKLNKLIFFFIFYSISLHAASSEKSIFSEFQTEQNSKFELLVKNIEENDELMHCFRCFPKTGRSIIDINDKFGSFVSHLFAHKYLKFYENNIYVCPAVVGTKQCGLKFKNNLIFDYHINQHIFVNFLYPEITRKKAQEQCAFSEEELIKQGNFICSHCEFHVPRLFPDQSIDLYDWLFHDMQHQNNSLRKPIYYSEENFLRYIYNNSKISCFGITKAFFNKKSNCYFCPKCYSPFVNMHKFYAHLHFANCRPKNKS